MPCCPDVLWRVAPLRFGFACPQNEQPSVRRTCTSAVLLAVVRVLLGGATSDECLFFHLEERPLTRREDSVCASSRFSYEQRTPAGSDGSERGEGAGISRPAKRTLNGSEAAVRDSGGRESRAFFSSPRRSRIPQGPNSWTRASRGVTRSFCPFPKADPERCREKFPY